MAIKLARDKDKPSAEPSSWTELPSNNDSQDKPNEDEDSDDSVSAAELSAAALDEVRQLAGKLERGLQGASAALTPPQSSDLRALMSSVNLPAIQADDALQSLALRLDRESDYWRGLALRALTRAVWADRFTQAIAVLAAIGCVGLAITGGLGAAFGSGNLWARLALLLGGTVMLAAGAAVVAISSAGVRRAQRSIGSDAQARADLAELRLQRVAVVLAARQHDEQLFVEALARLEREVTAPTGQRRT